jgi:DNA-binding transcriptional LysR family regulator
MSLNLNRLGVFVAVCEHRSFTAAADALDLAKSAVSDHVTRLEVELGVQLLVRSTRKLSLTSAGESFLATCRGLLDEVDHATRRLKRVREEPAGRLRVTATLDLALTPVGQIVAKLAARYPELEVELIATDEVLDLIAARIDVAIRAGRLKDSSLHATRLATFEQWVVAAPSYLKQRGRPESPAALVEHSWLTLTVLTSPNRWPFHGRDGRRQTVSTRGVLAANSASLVHRWALAGAGTTVLPDYRVREDIARGQLIRVLPDWRLPQGGVHAVFPSARYAPARVRVFIEALRGAM